MITHLPKSIFMYALATIQKHTIREAATLSSSPTLSLQVIEQAAIEFDATLSRGVKYSLNGRFERGVLLARQGAVTPTVDPSQPDKKRLFQVRSSNFWKPPYHYLVDLDAKSCEYPDHMKGYFCKHRIASHIIELAIQATLQPAPPPKGMDIKPIAQETTPPSKVLDIKPIVQETATRPAVAEPQSNIPSPDKDAIIWAAIRLNGKILGVEIVSLVGETATIRALPQVIDGKKLQPQFPFEGKRATTTIPQKELFHVKVFQ